MVTVGPVLEWHVSHVCLKRELAPCFYRCYGYVFFSQPQNCSMLITRLSSLLHDMEFCSMSIAIDLWRDMWIFIINWHNHEMATRQFPLSLSLTLTADKAGLWDELVCPPVCLSVRVDCVDELDVSNDRPVPIWTVKAVRTRLCVMTEDDHRCIQPVNDSGTRYTWEHIQRPHLWPHFVRDAVMGVYLLWLLLPLAIPHALCKHGSATERVLEANFNCRATYTHTACRSLCMAAWTFSDEPKSVVFKFK